MTPTPAPHLRPSSGLSRHLVAVCLLGSVGGFGAHTLVAAQTVGYTYKELTKPSGTLGCLSSRGDAVLTHHLNRQGDVAATCLALGGYRFGAYTISGYNPFAVNPWYLWRPVLWKAGAAGKVLAMPGKTGADLVGPWDNGEVTAVLIPQSSTSTDVLSSERTEARWPTVTQRVAWQPCGPAANVTRAMSRTGRYACFTNGATQIQVSEQGDRVRALPPLPSGLTYSDVPGNLRINDAGQVAVLLPQAQGTPPLWLWDGASWAAAPMPAGVVPDLLVDLNNSGAVLVRAGYRNWYLWSSTQVSRVELGEMFASGMDDEGRILGRLPAGPSTASGTAALWQRGEVIAVQGLITNWPTKWATRRVVDSLPNGQLLLEVTDTAQKFPNSEKLVVLTPR